MLINKLTAQILAGGVALAAITTATAHSAATAEPARVAARASLDRATVVRWVEGYLKAWRDKDDVAVGKLFAHDAVYQEVPGDDDHTYIGRDAIREYWRTITRAS